MKKLLASIDLFIYAITSYVRESSKNIISRQDELVLGDRFLLFMDNLTYRIHEDIRYVYDNYLLCYSILLDHGLDHISAVLAIHSAYAIGHGFDNGYTLAQVILDLDDLTYFIYSAVFDTVLEERELLIP